MSILNDLKMIQNLDSLDMYHKVIHMPEMIFKAYKAPVIHRTEKFEKLDLAGINRIVICGMGGSAISGDIAKASFENIIPIEVVKDYQIPYLDKNTLVITLSYSGNTEETLSCLQQAIKITPYVGAVTSGGKMKEIVDGEYLWLQLPAGYPPRSAIGYLFFTLLKLMEEFKIIPQQAESVNATIANLMNKAGAIAKSIGADKNLAKLAATQLHHKIPIVYATNPKYASLAYRWKCQINENAKYPAFSHTFPEMNHNEIEGWEVNGFDNIMPVLLSSMKEADIYQKRVNAFKKILKKKNIDYLEFFVEGKTLIEEIFSLIYLGDMISFYLAILQNVNPTSIDFIDFLKQEI